MQETWVWSLSQKDLLATHSSVLVWRIPWTVHGVWVHGLFSMEKSMGSQRVRHNWATFAHSVCLFSHVSAYLWPFPKILVHYLRFSGALQSNEFPRKSDLWSRLYPFLFWSPERVGGKNVREAGGDHVEKDETKSEKELENEKKEGTEFPCSLWVYHSPQISACLDRGVSKPPPFGLLWRLHYYIGMVDWVICYWRLNQTQLLSPLPTKGGLKGRIFYSWLVSLTTNPPL